MAALCALTPIGRASAQPDELPPPEAEPGEPLGTDPATDAEPHAGASVGIEALVLPTRLVVAGGRSSPALRRRIATLDALLTDTAQDLGLLVDLIDRSRRAKSRLDEQALVALAKRQGKLAVLPIVRVGPRERRERLLELRVVAARPGSRTLLSRVERVAPEDLSVRAVVMLRDVVSGLGPRSAQTEPTRPPPPLVEPAHSVGRAILATNGTLFGGFIGYSLQKAAGSEDPRLLYPLVGVGAGVGLGAAIIVADEWDVGVGDAWYLAAGAWWPAVASHLIYEGRFADNPAVPDGEQWAFGLIASTTGLGLSTIGLLNRGMGDGGAALAHSGGGVGLIVGGLAELAASGSAEDIPLAGMGYGAMAGWLLGSATAIHIHPPAARVLTIDLGSFLGTLAGAAAASPLLFDEPTPGETRGWVAAAGGGLVAGTALAWYLTEPDAPEAPAEPTAVARSRPRELIYRYSLPYPALFTQKSRPPTTSVQTGFAVASQAEQGLPPAAGVQWDLVLW